MSGFKVECPACDGHNDDCMACGGGGKLLAPKLPSSRFVAWEDAKRALEAQHYKLSLACYTALKGGAAPTTLAEVWVLGWLESQKAPRGTSKGSKEMIHVPSYGPLDAKYAAVGQSPGRQEGAEGRPFVGPAGSLARKWLEGVSIDPDSVRYLNVYEYVLVGGEQPSGTEVKHGIDRIKRDLAEMPNLKAVILFGSFAARCAFSLKGGITRAQGHQGTLELSDGRQVPCIACLHPSFVLRQKSLRQKQQLDHDCQSVVARLPILDRPLVLPDVTLITSVIDGHMGRQVSGLIGLDTETSHQVGKRVNPRKDPLLITGLSDGRVLTEAPWFEKDAEPIVYNVPFDPVVEIKAGACGPLVSEQPKWHDPKMLAHLLGESDTTMKGVATRLLNRPMMEYDPGLRERAAAKIHQGVGLEDEEVQSFCAYCVQDAVAHKDILSALLTQADVETKWLYENVERPMFRLYSKWSAMGVFRLDRPAALVKRDVLDGQIRKMRRDLEAATGVDSPHKHAQLQKALNLPSTGDAFVRQAWSKLTKKQKDALTLLGRVRSLEKQGSTYLDAWLEWPDPLLSTNWRGTAAWTGRPGSADLNLQNIPGPCGSCTPCRKGEVSECPFNLKPLLLAPEGMVLYELDNSQAEIRVAAHVSQDPAMIQAFTEGVLIDGERVYDLHAWAMKMLNMTSRRDAKIRVLATLYGQTEQGVSASPKIQAAIRSTFKGYIKWSAKVSRLSVVPGLFGRQMYVPPHPNRAHRAREAINCPSQGGAADLWKLQEIALEDKRFDTRHGIHDSCLVVCDESDAGEEFLRTAIETMENAVELSVPMKVAGGLWPHD